MPMYHCLPLGCSCKIKTEEFDIVGSGCKNLMCHQQGGYRRDFFKVLNRNLGNF